jgi:hypothetical protein
MAAPFVVSVPPMDLASRGVQHFGLEYTKSRLCQFARAESNPQVSFFGNGRVVHSWPGGPVALQWCDCRRWSRRARLWVRTGMEPSNDALEARLQEARGAYVFREGNPRAIRLGAMSMASDEELEDRFQEAHGAYVFREGKPRAVLEVKSPNISTAIYEARLRGYDRPRALRSHFQRCQRSEATSVWRPEFIDPQLTCLGPLFLSRGLLSLFGLRQLGWQAP